MKRVGRRERSYNARMRAAYAVLGLAWLVIFAGLFALNRNFTSTSHNASMATSSLALTSPAFDDNGNIPSKFTCDAKGTDSQVSPALSISGVPLGAVSLALIMDDPDVPKQLKPDGVFDHWVLFDIPPETKEIPEGGSAGIVGANGSGKHSYTGPCPPKQYEPSEHRYVFKLYVLDTMLSLDAGASKPDVEQAMEGHIIAQTQRIGRYKRP